MLRLCATLILLLSACTPPGSVALHGSCRAHADCDAGVQCVEWSQPATLPFGIRTTRVSRTCEVLCRTDANCPTGTRCGYEAHGPGWNCRDRGPNWMAPRNECSVVTLSVSDAGCAAKVAWEPVAWDADAGVGLQQHVHDRVQLRCGEDVFGCVTTRYRCECGVDGGGVVPLR